MPGLHPQSKRKRDKRAVDMSRDQPPPEPAWEPPTQDELDEEQTYPMPPPGADPTTEKVIVKVCNLISTGELAKFAVIQQTFHRGKWRDVVVVDHHTNDNVHLHRYGRTTDDRVGNPEYLMDLRALSDVQFGYNMAYTKVVEEWALNKQRWQNA
jgi:hypothetical protein